MREAAASVNFPLRPPVERYKVVDALPGVTFSAPTSMESPAGDTQQLYVAERRGTIMLVTNVAAPGPKIQFLDISTRVTNDNSELGLKGIAFHPHYASNGYFFVTYCATGDRVRLSRFTRDALNPLVADPDSELVLIDQANEGRFHNINDAHFGPDGYLYVGFGDEGSPGDSRTNTQTITKNFWSAILRIDPDKRPGNLEPNPHPAIPLDTNGLAHYSVPADNPFVGATQFLGVAVDSAAVRTEFFAVGFRNPWQFSFDPATGELWVADVGHQSWESVLVMPPGGNAGWAFFEGPAPGPRTPPPGFTPVEPVWTYPHDIGPYAGSAVIGGLVLRNGVYPDLEGKYLCTDVIKGHIWSVDRTGGTTTVERIAGASTIVQFALDPSNGQVLMLDYDLGHVRRLVENEEAFPFPAHLSETGLFQDLADLTPMPGVVPYAINLPFWSDYAVKQRWFAVTNLYDAFGYRRDEPWDTPVGAVWVKHFDLDLDRGATNTRRRVETRVLVRTTNGVYGVSYRWNAAQSDAQLVPDMGDIVDLPITNVGIQRWSIPARDQCLLCHRSDAGYILGFNTRQLNQTGTLGSVSGNFIDLLALAGYLTNVVESPLTLPRYVRPAETNYSLEVRARSYLAVNCGYCHQGPGSVAGANWDGRAHLALESCGLVRVPPLDPAGNTNNLLLAPGDEVHSVIVNRMAAANGFSRMPPLATSMLDEEGIQLMVDWIKQQLPGWQSYADWRLAYFNSTNSPSGDPDADPDADTRSNWEEFLTRSDPTNDTSYWTGQIALAPNGVEVSYVLANRGVLVETSADLLNWSPWAVNGNHGLPVASGQVVRLNAPSAPSNAFFRFRIEAR